MAAGQPDRERALQMAWWMLLLLGAVFLSGLLFLWGDVSTSQARVWLALTSLLLLSVFPLLAIPATRSMRRAARQGGRDAPAAAKRPALRLGAGFAIALAVVLLIGQAISAVGGGAAMAQRLVLNGIMALLTGGAAAGIVILRTALELDAAPAHEAAVQDGP